MISFWKQKQSSVLSQIWTRIHTDTQSAEALRKLHQAINTQTNLFHEIFMRTGEFQKLIFTNLSFKSFPTKTAKGNHSREITEKGTKPKTLSDAALQALNMCSVRNEPNFKLSMQSVLWKRFSLASHSYLSWYPCHICGPHVLCTGLFSNQGRSVQLGPNGVVECHKERINTKKLAVPLNPNKQNRVKILRIGQIL